MAKTETFYDITELNTAIAATLATIVGLKLAQDLDQLTEQIPDPDMPLAQVYPDNWESTSNSDTSVATFGRGLGRPVQILPITFHADIYVGQLTYLFETMPRLAVIAQSINEKLNDQPLSSNPFGHGAIQAFTWTAQRSIFNYSKADYLGIRYVLSLEVF